MSFTKNDLEIIKSKIQLSREIEKKVKVKKKGNDYWCCCPFHEEKTPSCKINDDLGSYYCFGCGAKGDIFTIYTELYNYSFPDAVKELAQQVGLKLTEENSKQHKENDIIYRILESATQWFEKNLIESELGINYLKKRKISKQTINDFRIGFAYNSKTSLYNYLKNLNFKDEDILKSNVAKRDSNNNIRDFFYKRLIFPILNTQNKIVGFGGRVLDNSNPKYINSPESNFFKKRELLYNLNLAKKNIREKQNILICEGYMDVISLYQNNIKTAVAPLGTALTETQLFLSWKHVSKPTVMFDGDLAGLKASLKTALMALPHLSPNKYLQFIKLPNNYDPDSFINDYSLSEFIKILKKPVPIVNFIFDESVANIDLTVAENKISFDKYLEEIVDTIKDNKIKYFYKNEFKNLFFKKIKTNNRISKLSTKPLPINSLIEKQIYSFFTAFLKHNDIRNEIYELLKNTDLLDNKKMSFLNYLKDLSEKSKDLGALSILSIPDQFSGIYKKINESSVFQLFPYSKQQYDSTKALSEIQESVKNLNTRLSNLKKINKSLDKIEDGKNSFDLEELKKITLDLHNSKEK